MLASAAVVVTLSLKHRGGKIACILITCGHFRSRDKNGGHTIRSAIAQNPMLHADFMALCFKELELFLPFLLK